MNELEQVVLAVAREDYSYNNRSRERALDTVGYYGYNTRFHGSRCECLLCDEKRDRAYNIREHLDEYGNKIIERYPALAPEEKFTKSLGIGANKILVTPTEVQLPVPSGATIMQWIGWGGTAIVVLVHLSRMVGS